MWRGALLCWILWGTSALAQDRIRIGAEDDWRPYSYAVAGEPAGFAVDIVRAAWTAAGVDVELVSLPYSRCMIEVERGALAGCFDTLRNPLIEFKFRWHQQPLFKARIGIYGRVGSGNGRAGITEQNLRGKRIGITHGYEYGEAFDSDARVLREMAPSDLSSLRKLAAGRVDYALVYERNADLIMANNPDWGRTIEQQGILTEPHLYLSFSRSFPGVERYIALFDQGLAKVHSSGEYARIDARWR